MQTIGICTYCGRPCYPKTIDAGRGHYEYWGCPGNDTHLDVVSSCCEEPIVDTNNNPITITDVDNQNELEKAQFIEDIDLFNQLIKK